MAINSLGTDFDVIFLEKLPEEVCGDSKGLWDELPRTLAHCPVVSLKELGDFLRDKISPSVTLSPAFADIRCYRYRHRDASLFMFFNTSVSESFTGNIELPLSKIPQEYDAFENRLYQVNATLVKNGRVQIHITLAPGESRLMICCQDSEKWENLPRRFYERPWVCDTDLSQQLSGTWRISLCEPLDYPDFKCLMEDGELTDIGVSATDFSGYICYEKTVESYGDMAGFVEIDNASDGMEVWVNGEYAGMCISPSYRFDVKLQKGLNSVKILLATTMAHKVSSMVKDTGPWTLPGKILAPEGIVGKIYFNRYSEEAADT